MPDVRYIIDEAGHRTAVILDPADYEKLPDALRAYDEAKASGGEAIPFDLRYRLIEGDGA